MRKALIGMIAAAALALAPAMGYAADSNQGGDPPGDACTGPNCGGTDFGPYALGAGIVAVMALGIGLAVSGGNTSNSTSTSTSTATSTH